MEILGKQLSEIVDLPNVERAKPEEVETTPIETQPENNEGSQEANPAQSEPETHKEDQPVQSDPYSDLLKDDFVKGFLESFVSNDDNFEKLLEDELNRVRTSKIDFNTLPDEEIIRIALKKEYPDLSSSALEKVINKHLSQFGDLSDYDEEDEEYASEKQIRDANIKREADKYRKQLTEEQAKFKRRSADDIKAEVTSKQQAMQEQAQQEFEKWERMVTGNEFVSKVLESGEMKVGKADNELGFKVKDVDKFKKALTSDPEFFNLFSTGDKQNPVDLKKWAKVVAYALDPEGFESMLLVTGKNAGTGKILDELENPVKPNAPQASAPSSLAESLMGAISKRR